MIEKFGINEKALTDEQWLDIARKMKTDPHIRHKTLRYVAEAEQYVLSDPVNPKGSKTCLT